MLLLCNIYYLPCPVVSRIMGSYIYYELPIVFVCLNARTQEGRLAVVSGGNRPEATRETREPATG